MNPISFTLCVADIPIAVQALYPQTARFCRAYLSDLPPRFSISITPEHIAAERAWTRRYFVGYQDPHFPDFYYERQSLYHQAARLLIGQDVLLFHASAVAVDGGAYLFAAPAGTGKSTHTRLWRELLGPRAVMINDDKPLLKFTPDGFLACGSPWNGKHRLGANLCVPLRALCILLRADRNFIMPLSPEEAYPSLLRQSYRLDEPEAMARILSLLDRLSRTVPIYRLGCTADISAAQLSYQVLAKGE